MKMFMKTLLVGSMTLTAPSMVLAHQGHDDAPGMVRSMHGGVVKPGKNLNMELVSEGNKVSFYPLAHEGDKLDASALQIEAKAKDPKGKSSAVKLVQNADTYAGEIDFKGNQRNEIEVKTIYKGKVDTFKFQVEKQ